MEARKILENYGRLRPQEVNGRVITILPTCDLPFEHLLEENWRRTWSDDPVKESSNSDGKYRFVWNIQRLYDRENGEQVALYVKHPERVFTASREQLKKGCIWWGGPRSGEGRPLYLRHPLVEEQTIWQAVYLLELYRQGIPAEVPLAIVEWPSGSHKLGDSELILHDVKEYCYPDRFSDKDAAERIRELRFIPEDYGGHNIVSTSDEKPAIIDVNRWLWPPYTDEWSSSLLELIKKELNLRN